jgi:hypothetical protein
MIIACVLGTSRKIQNFHREDAKNAKKYEAKENR